MQTLLLIDLDGTLIDTPHYEAWRNAAHQFGLTELTHEEYLANIAGRPRLEGASRLLDLKKAGLLSGLDRLNNGNISMLAEIKQAEFLRLSVYARLFDDAVRLLKRVELSSQEVKFYTASQNASSLFDDMLRKESIILNQQSIVRQKQDQTREELFLSLIEERTPKEVTLIDDSPHSIDVACNLGIQAYQIHRNELLPMATDQRAFIIPSLNDISIPIVEII
ncbi:MULTISPECIES: HAD hydrolase-like protein [Photorhabdus]|uniref:HAD hydrolase-like protein n=1 Tax=Photorhabdus kayaii TaxID=230088 RepID=A0ABX0B504_9GAMM|nr:MULTISPECIES: HAD hydrolase-like protein [Photorhabdus]MCC8375999.1 HAD hydrolase-like protein [Photorhabdus bodei]MCC8465988.1 HAD hydrolase-like protein [Photorhabdus bodei]MCT8353996.1 HAD hydrolase-like protein [Photorhabdus kayaii]MDB6370319.1 HAD hydrolase-like protein [Photorhabdus bodei]NDL14440.1 HAD hydrolase-like protein [Photorhabdus kayaii]